MSTNTASSTITCSIRVNANTKRIFDKVCERIGITPSAAYSIFTNAVAAEQRIPFELTAAPCNVPQAEVAMPLDEMRAELDKKGLLRDYTMDEINAIIDEARKTPLSTKDQEFIDELFQD